MEFREALCPYFFVQEHPFAQGLVEKYARPWDLVAHLDEVFREENLVALPLERVEENIWAEPGAEIEGGALVEGRLVVGAGTVVRRHAVLRGDVVLGRGCVIGHFTEVKNSLFYDGVQLPHLSYVGDSVLGRGAHLGAGAKISNYKSYGTQVNVVLADGKFPTGLVKFGAAVGDGVEVGCNAVLNPGSLIGPRSVVYPLVNFRGAVPAGTVVKSSGFFSTRE